MAEFRDLTGQSFNRWKVIKYAGTRVTPSKQIKTFWLCVCDCGNQKEVYSNSLTSGKSKSCGCIRGRELGYAARTNIYSNYRCKARRRGLEFNITEEEFDKIAQNNCFYCGISPSNHAYNRQPYKGGYKYNGLDRIDNNLGYMIDNIVPCCKDCNLAKRELSQSEFFEMVKRIYERHL